MKKLKFLLVLLMMFAFSIPMVNAEEASAKSEVNVYLFKGDGCGYCANALSFFQSIEEEYGQYFNLVEYEVWYDADNSELMYEVADYMGATIQGVPFIVIGNESYPGFNESMQESIKKQILDEYNLGEAKRTDIIKKLESGINPNESRNKKILFVSVVAVVGLVGFVVLARNGIEDEEVVVSLNESKEDVKELKETKNEVVEEDYEETYDGEEFVEDEDVVEEEPVVEEKKPSKNKKSSKKNVSTSKKKPSNSKKKATKMNVNKKN